MFKDATPFSGFSVNDLEAARQFYGQTLGIDIENQPGMGFELRFRNGHRIFIYPKPEHQPASFTVLNFPVDDIDRAVDELAGKGVSFERYDMPPLVQDEKGIARGRTAGMGPDIAWFKDPAGNILSVLQPPA